MIQRSLPFDTPSGRRVQVEAFKAQTLFPFLSGYLVSGKPDPTNPRYILDSKGQAIGATAGVAKVGARPHAPGLLRLLPRAASGRYRENGTERFFTSAPVQGSSWRVVLSEPTSRLYPPAAGSRNSLRFAVLAAFALAGLVSIALLRRALVSGAQFADLNRELTRVNTTWSSASPSARLRSRIEPGSSHARMPSSSNSPRSPRTIYKSRCARSACSATAWRRATARRCPRRRPPISGGCRARPSACSD